MEFNALFSGLPAVAGMVFCLCAAVHLTACFIQQESVRRITKPALMPLLLLWNCLVSSPSPAVLCALLLGMIGDFLLLEPDKPVFFSGGLAAFLAGHLCWLAEYSRYLKPEISKLPVLVIIVSLYTAYAILSIRLLKCPPGLLRTGVICYTIVLELLHFTSVCIVTGILVSIGDSSQVAGNSIISAYLFLAGSSFFLISDSILALTIFRKDLTARLPLQNFLIMLTYIAAQMCLAFGTL